MRIPRIAIWIASAIGSAVFLLGILGYDPPGKAATQNQTAAPSQTAQQSAPAQPGRATPLQAENGSPARTDPATRDLESLRDMEANYLRAEMEDNAALAESILADDYLGVTAGGVAADKQQVLHNLAMRPRGREPYTISASNMREHLFGDTACVTYTKVYALPSGTTYSEHLLHIFTRRNGRWHLQVSSPIPASQPQAAAKR